MLPVRHVSLVFLGLLLMLSAAEPEDRLREARSLFAKSQYAEALAVYQQVLADHPGSAIAPAAAYEIAMCHLRQDNTEAAIPALQLVLETYPDHQQASQAAYELGRCYLSLNQPQAALTAFERALPTADAETRELARLGKGSSLLHLRRYAPAADHYQHVLNNHPESDHLGDILYKLGWARVQANQLEPAIEPMQRFLDSFPDHPAHRDARLTLADAYLGLDQTEQALTVLQPLLELEPPVPAARYRQALALADQKKQQEAIAVLRELLTAEPGQSLALRAQLQLGHLLAEADRHEAAVPHLSAVAEIGPKALRHDALYRLGLSQVALDRHQQAKKAFAQLAEESPGQRYQAKLWLAQCAEALGQRDEAIRLYEEVAAPEVPPALAGQAMLQLAYLYQGDEALANLQRYQQRYPEGQLRHDLQLAVANRLLDDGNQDDAQTLYQPLTEPQIGPTHRAAAWLGLGWIALARQDADAALAAFAKVDKAQAPASVYQQATLQRADIYFRQGRYEAAEPLAASLRELPGTIGARATYIHGWCRQQAGDLETAAERFSEALRREPDGNFAIDARLNLARIRYQQGRIDEARATLSPVAEQVQGDARRLWLDLYTDLLVAQKAWTDLLAISQQISDEELAASLTYPVGLAHQELGNFADAIRHFSQVVASGREEAAKAEYQLGVIAYLQDRYADAGQHFQRVADDYDAPQLTPIALYHAIDAYRQLEPTEATAQSSLEALYEQLHRSYPSSPWTTRAARLLGKEPAAQLLP